ncbi:MAG: chromosome partitioning ATPase [Rhodospirillaceae bacterium]|nr:MAG: chromosome partitioning ATPase [Rhodospirillaceae bacterium]
MTRRAHIIVVGNEKGGTGKSTITMHVMVSLMNMGLRVGSIDLDARQATLTRYVENRRVFLAQHHLNLPVPTHEAIVASDPFATGMALEEDLQRLDTCVNTLRATCDIIIIDTPGSDHYLSRLGHTYADTLLTPLNDSLIDLDVLARVNPDTMRVSGPSHYAEMVWQIRKQRAMDDGESIAWVVTRNRLSQIGTRGAARRVPFDCGVVGTGHLSRVVPERPDVVGFAGGGRRSAFEYVPRGRPPRIAGFGRCVTTSCAGGRRGEYVRRFCSVRPR